MLLAVRLTPRGGRDGADGWAVDADGRPYLKVRVTSAPVEGEANAALISFVAKSLRIPKSAVRMAAGATSRLKRLEIDGVEEADLERVFGPRPWSTGTGAPRAGRVEFASGESSQGRVRHENCGRPKETSTTRPLTGCWCFASSQVSALKLAVGTTHAANRGDKASMGVSETQSDLARAASSRRANLYLRLFATVTISVILYVFVDMRWVWIWAGLYLAALTLEFWIAREVLANPEVRPARWRRRVLAALPFVTAAIFGFLALPLFASHQRFAPTLGGMLLAGALLNVIVVNAGQRSATLWAAAPHVLYLLAAPMVARAANPDAPLANALWVGALLLIASVTVASRTLDAALKAEADAKREAELRRHEAEEAVAAKSAFVAMISHELRTPISAILAGAARLHSDVPEASSKIHAQLISDAGGLMRALLNDLLDFSRLEVGRMAVENAPFNLRQTLADTLRLWRPELARKGLRLRIEGSATLPRWVAGDALRLRQVLNNLLSNAIKFTDRGVITVRFDSRQDGVEQRLTIMIADTGSGISPANLSRLFTPFEQLSTSVVRQHGGSGLGLVISRELARLMGGDLAVSSVEGQGATFTLTLTVEAAEAPTAEDSGPSIAGARVLVVDDHVVNRRAIELVLQPFGVEATLAESGEQALELLGTEVFDAVLMDVYMPGMDGREATRTLRAGSGPNRDTPVVAVTASATPKDWEACLAAGMNAHVAKPIDPIELYTALTQVLAGGVRVAA